MAQKTRGLLGTVRVKEEDLERQNKKKSNLVVPPHDGFAQRTLGQEVLEPRAEVEKY